MRFLIVGCGRIGAGLAKVLDARGHTVTLLDTDQRAAERLGTPFSGRAIIGSGLDRVALIEAGIDRADGLAAVTNSDEANVVVARLARSVFQVPRVVARLFDPVKLNIYQRLHVQVVAPGQWALNRFCDLLSYSELDTVLSLGNGEVEVVETEVSPLLVGRKLSAITIPGEVHVIALSRRGKTFLPTSEVVFQAGDILHIALLATSIESLRDMLTPR